MPEVSTFGMMRQEDSGRIEAGRHCRSQASLGYREYLISTNK
jgi:hypothetical protein